MTVQSGPGERGTRHIASRYPVEEGLEAGTTKQTKPIERKQSLMGGAVHGS